MLAPMFLLARICVGAALLTAPIVMIPQTQAPALDRRTSVEPGAWSGKAVSLFNTWGGLDSNPGRKLSLSSPDGTKTISVRNDTVTLVVSGKQYPTGFGARTNAELGWAPDSRHFFLTWTDAGVTGQWHTQLYVVTDTGLQEIKGFSDAARRDFARVVRKMAIPADLNNPLGRRYWSSKEYCPLNVAGSQFLNGSSEFLLSVLVPNTSRCRQMSEFNVYRLAIPGGKILQRYTAKEAHGKFGDDDLPVITE